MCSMISIASTPQDSILDSSAMSDYIAYDIFTSTFSYVDYAIINIVKSILLYINNISQKHSTHNLLIIDLITKNNYD
jgi:hypothetical protein